MTAPDVPRTTGAGLPAAVRLHVWSVAARDVPRAMSHVAADRFTLRRNGQLRFYRILGTGTGRTFTPSDADLRRWALLTVWDTPAARDAFEHTSIVAAWDAMAVEGARVDLVPLASRGSWAGRTPFGDPRAHRWDGPVAAITRARIRLTRWREFWQAVPPVSTDLREVPGLSLAFGIGEAPVGLQGTFSMWRSNRDLTEFARRRTPHRDVMDRTVERDWYVEELFARFAVVAATGRIGDVDLADLAPPA